MGVGDSDDNYYDDSFHQATADWAKAGGLDVNKPVDKTIKTASPLVNITPEDIDKAINIGLSAGPGTMMGVTSKVFDKNALAHAQVLEAAGIHPDEIWKETGTIRGAEGRWKQEISDHKATMREGAAYKIDSLNDPRLGHIFDHPDLYEAYPWAQNLKITADPRANMAAYHTPDSISLGENMINKDVILHEVQHAIQDREGFAAGGSAANVFALNYEKDIAKHRSEFDKFVNDLKYRQANNETTTREDVLKLNFYNKLFQTDAARRTEGIKEAFKNYQRLAGEVESRNTETRALLTDIERRKMSPRWTEDTPPSEQLISEKPIWTTPYGMAENPMKAPIP